MQPSKMLLALLLGACATFAACSPQKPWMMEKSNLEPKPIALKESREIIKKPLMAMSSADVATAAAHYTRTGAGPIYVVVAYKDHGKIGDSAIKAKAAEITGALLNAGIAESDIVASIVPLETPEPIALIAYDSLQAQAPAGCTAMPGLDAEPIGPQDFNYSIGCGVKSMIARQIANPRDLEGRAGLTPGADGERAAAIISTQYKSGEPRAYLPSYIISELAGKGS